MTEPHFQIAHRDAPTTSQKALRINMDASKFGTFAEIGAGQEVVGWFFHAGRAAATVAKSISAYDTVVSDDIYGPTDHYVSRARLTAMLDHEYALLLKELDSKRGDKTSFFAFAETVATHSRAHQAGGHGWLGIRFQTQPRSQPSEIILHVQLLDPATTGEQQALGVLGVNLIHGAFYCQDPAPFIGSLMDSLSRAQIEVDMIKFSGPAFPAVDNRLMSLQLVEQSLTDAVMFTVEGEVIQPSEVLYDKPVLVERGSFRPATNVNLDMLSSALAQIQEDDPQIESRDPVVLMEMTLNNLITGRGIDHQDFLDRVDTLGAMGKMVLISNYTRFDRVTTYLRNSTRNWIAMAMGVPTLLEIFDEKYYTDLVGGILEGLGRLFRGAVKLYVYPMKGIDGQISTAETLAVAPGLRHLYAHLLENGFIQPIREFREEQLHIFPDDVLAMIQSGDGAWENIVPAPVAERIKARRLFGWQGGA